MKIDKLKVRPKKAARAAPCAAEFATMLACWASHNDLANSAQCSETAKALQICMRSKVGLLPETMLEMFPMKGHQLTCDLLCDRLLVKPSPSRRSTTIWHASTNSFDQHAYMHCYAYKRSHQRH